MPEDGTRRGAAVVRAADRAGRGRALGRTGPARRRSEAGLPQVVSLGALRGTSLISVEGGPFCDPDADQALLDGLYETLGPSVEVNELDTDINDEAFALATADRLHDLIQEVTALTAAAT